MRPGERVAVEILPTATGYKAYVPDRPLLWACGKTADEALGRLSRKLLAKGPATITEIIDTS